MHLAKESAIIPQTNTFSSDDLKILNLYDFNYLSHDVFTIFNRFMIQSGIITNFMKVNKVYGIQLKDLTCI